MTAQDALSNWLLIVGLLGAGIVVVTFVTALVVGVVATGKRDE
jgi:hypothetical protein